MTLPVKNKKLLKLHSGPNSFGLSFSIFLMFILLFFSCKNEEEQVDENNQIDRPYSLGRVGNQEDLESESESGLVLMGGSTDVDEAMQWMIDRAGGGDFVIIRSSGGTGYNSYLYNFGNLNSVETFRIDSRLKADDEALYEALIQAEALFIAGGDQSQYMQFWQGTRVEDAIQYLVHEKGIPIGGTSAGCAIMGPFVFTGELASITSDEALADPLGRNNTVRQSTLIDHPFLAGGITDQHFSQRNREGRLISFLARIKSENWHPQPWGIAVDERTALVIDKDQQAKVLGEHQVFLIQEKDPSLSPEQLERGQALHWELDQEALQVFTLDSNTSPFKLSDWSTLYQNYWYVSDGQWNESARD